MSMVLHKVTYQRSRREYYANNGNWFATVRRKRSSFHRHCCSPLLGLVLFYCITLMIVPVSSLTSRTIFCGRVPIGRSPSRCQIPLTTRSFVDRAEAYYSSLFLYPPNRYLSSMTTTSSPHNIATEKFQHVISSPKPKGWEEIFSLELPEGHCVGIHLVTENILRSHFEELQSILHPEELQYGKSFPSQSAQFTFFVGRLAMHTALGTVFQQGQHSLHGMNKSLVCQSILKDEHGRPILPKGFLGSISHKRMIGVALVALDEDLNGKRRGIGVDIEQTYSRRQNVAKRVLTENERQDLGKIKGVTKDEEVLLRFSLKESMYKAMHPLICQRVGFQEAEITPHENGTATVTLDLKNKAHEKFTDITAHWRRVNGEHFLTSASVTMREVE